MKHLNYLILSMLLMASGIFTYAQTPSFAKDDYQKALWMTARFYGAQRSGNGPNWLLAEHAPPKGASFVKDADGAYDLTGGWFDCGDHVKFGQTQYYSGYMLLLGYSEFTAGYDDNYSFDYNGYIGAKNYTWEGKKGKPNGIPDILDEVKYATDYFKKCVRDNKTFYYQVGDGRLDHIYWVTSSTMSTFPNYDGGEANGSRVVAKATGNVTDMASLCGASLAAMYRLYKQYDATYAQSCLDKALVAYDFVNNTPKGTSAAAFTDYDGEFYGKKGSYLHDMIIFAIELYRATDDNKYITDAETFANQLGSGEWTQWWTTGYNSTNDYCYYLLATYANNATLKAKAKASLQDCVNRYKPASGNLLKTIDSWGTLRYGANQAFVYALNDKLNGTTTINPYSLATIEYIMGKNGQNHSFIVGFGANHPQYPHHRNIYLDEDAYYGGTIQPKYMQFGMMVGGSWNDGYYDDDVYNYAEAEGGIDYNAGLVSALGYINSVLYPVCTTRFNVTFDSNGGAPTPGTQVVCDGGKASKPATDPSQTGFTFKGWYTAATGGSAFNFTTTPITAAIKLYAQWTPCTTFNVTFDSNGGSPTPATQKICTGEKAAEPAAPSLAGSVFNGWYNGTTKFNFATMTITGDVNLKAQWAAEANTLVADCETSETNVCTGWFNYAADNSYISDVEIIEGGAAVGNGYVSVDFNIYPGDWGAGFGFSMSATETPVDLTGATGITFYHKGAAGSVEIGTEQYVENFSASISAHGTWTKVTVPFSSMKGTYGSNQGMTLTNLSKVRTIQFGVQSGSGTFSLDHIQVNDINLPSCKVPCTTKFNVTFDSNGGTPTPAVQEVCDGAKASKPATDPTQLGFIFAGWYTAATGGSAFNFATTPITAATKLYAQWTKDANTVVADCETWATNVCTGWFNYADDNSTISDVEIKKGGAAVGNGYVSVDFDIYPGDWGAGFGFDISATETSVDLTGATGITFYHKGAAGSINVVTVQYGEAFSASIAAHGGWTKVTVPFSSMYGTYGSNDGLMLTNLTKVRAIQFGVQSGKGTFSLDHIQIDNIKLAQCIESYDITYHLDEGTNSALNPASYTSGTSVKLEDATKDGYDFKGWYNNEDFDGSPITSISAGETGPKEFWAKWVIATNIPVVSSDATVQIYPNPAKDGNFNVMLSNSETAVLTIANLQGQAIYSTVINNGFASINTNLGAGVYIVSVQSEGGLKTQKLIVK